MIRVLTAGALFFLWVALGFVPAALASEESLAQRLLEAKRPRLVVAISIDQFRADYLTRFTDLFLPARQADGKVGGFRYLMQEGSWFVDARYSAQPLFTCVGHATFSTGALPPKSGIIANRWWDRERRVDVYCVDDDRYRVVGAGEGSKARPMGPRQLRVTTVGDELKLATNGAAKVVTIALKDRAAIMMGGHTQDVSIWFDEMNGHWISSTAYARNGELPQWVQVLNRDAIPDRSLGTTWTASVSAAALARTFVPRLPHPPENGFGAVFPHAVGKEKNSTNYGLFTLLPEANAFVFETARRAVRAEGLGRGDVPDLLGINLSTNDYVGHAFGPFSPEVLDLTVRTDRYLAEFLQFLDAAVPGGLNSVLIVLTSDHGVTGVPEDLLARGIPAGRVAAADIERTAQTALQSAFGGGPWTGKGIGPFMDPHLYLNPVAVEQALASGKAKSRAQIEDVAAQAVAAMPGIHQAFTHSQVERGQLPDTEVARWVARGFHQQLSGDVLIVMEPGYFAYGTHPAAASHGSAFSSDTQVPVLLAGPGIRKGAWTKRVTPADIAPTLSLLLGIPVPNGNDGVLLTPALEP